MGVNWDAAVSNENTWLGRTKFDQLSDSEKQMLAGLGVDLSNVSGMESWRQNNPLTYEGALGFGSVMANESRYQQMLGLNRLREDLAAKQLNETGNVLANRAGAVMGDFQTAKNEIEGAGAAARRDIMGNQTQQLAANTASARARGLGNSTVLDSMRRGTAMDTGRNLASLGENLAQQRSGLAERQGAARASTLGDLADFMTRRTGIETGLMGDRIGLMERRNDNIDFGQQASAQALINRGLKSNNGIGSALGSFGGLLGGSMAGSLGSGLGGALSSGILGLLG